MVIFCSNWKMSLELVVFWIHCKGNLLRNRFLHLSLKAIRDRFSQFSSISLFRTSSLFIIMFFSILRFDESKSCMLLSLALKLIPAFWSVLVEPSLMGRNGQGEVDVAPHVPVVLVLVHQLGDELGCEGNQECLKKIICKMLKLPWFFFHWRGCSLIMYRD